MVPTARLYSQYPEWAGGRWRYAGSIFDPYTRQDALGHTTGLQRIVVTLGTEAFGFRRAVEKLLDVLPHHAEVLWQTGGTDATGLGIHARASVPGDELRAAISAADLVVSHAGTGSALTAFDLGKTPLILPRESKYHEHIDDHQMLTAKELERRGLAVAVPVGSLSSEHLELAMASRVVKDDISRPFELAEDSGFGRATVIELRARVHAGGPNANRTRATALAGDRASWQQSQSRAATE
ncbi:MAG: glycosyltransferase [Candidatus Nanopelagicales bacterium]